MQDAAAQRAAPLLMAAPGCRARACSMPAPRRAARRRTCSNSPISTCWRWTCDAQRLERVHDTPGAPRAARASLAARCRRPIGLVGRRALRRHPARRPAAPRASCAATRRALAAPRQRHHRPGAHPGAPARRAVAAHAEAAAAACCTAPVRSSRPRGRTRSTRFCNATATQRAAGRSHRGTCSRCPTMRAAAAARQWGRRLLLRPDPQDLTSEPHASARSRLTASSSPRDAGRWLALALAGRDGLLPPPAVELTTFAVQRRRRRREHRLRANFELPRAVEDALPAACRCTSWPRPRSSAIAGTGATSASPAPRASGASSTSRSPPTTASPSPA